MTNLRQDELHVTVIVRYGDRVVETTKKGSILKAEHK